jgi:2-polyprenyl-6-methoxyphenol hydroxylase-like FAD-dependent oxidoreductase
MDALIIGGGIAGISTALTLTEIGLRVELVERDEEIRTLGSGITLIAPALRALDRLGVLPACLDAGYGTSELQIWDVSGAPLASMPLRSPLGSELPGMMGMMRPALHQILLEAAARRGLNMRNRLTADTVDSDEDGASVTFSDGTRSRYDLVIGADGLRSTVREQVCGPVVEPDFLGQACYRAVLPRPEVVSSEVTFVGHPTVHIGFTPTGTDSMYLYCLVPAGTRPRSATEELPGIVREYLAPFGGVMAELRELITDSAAVNCVSLETIIVPEPWYRGRTVLVGDSAHATTPHMAAGAAMCLEDAIVLAEELDQGGSIPDALAAYAKRRYNRCKYVVETSKQLLYWQTHPDTPGADQERLRGTAIEVLSGPF